MAGAKRKPKPDLSASVVDSYRYQVQGRELSRSEKHDVKVVKLSQQQVAHAFEQARPAVLDRLKKVTSQGPCRAHVQARLLYHNPAIRDPRAAWEERDFPGGDVTHVQVNTSSKWELDKFWKASATACLHDIEHYENATGSGWVIVQVLWVGAKWYHGRITGGRYLSTPESLSQKAVLNVKNEDNRCAFYAVLAAYWDPKVRQAIKDKAGALWELLRSHGLTHASKHRETTRLYDVLAEHGAPPGQRFHWPGAFPYGLRDWDAWEAANPGFLVDVYAIEAEGGKAPVLTPWRVEHRYPAERESKHVLRLGLLGDRNATNETREDKTQDLNHYVVLNDITAMVRDHHNVKYGIKDTNAYEMCPVCLHYQDKRYLDHHMQTAHGEGGTDCRRLLPLPRCNVVGNCCKPVFPHKSDADKDAWAAKKKRLNVRRTLEFPCFMTADFECTLKPAAPAEDGAPSNTVNEHEPNSFSVVWWWQDPDGTGHTDRFTYVDTEGKGDVVQVFLRFLSSKARQLREACMLTNVPLDRSTVPASHSCATECHICKGEVHRCFEQLTTAELRLLRELCPDDDADIPTGPELSRIFNKEQVPRTEVARSLLAKLDYVKVADHDHRTGAYRGPAHSRCNREFTLKRCSVPVLFHNGTNYDFHFIVREINAHDEEEEEEDPDKEPDEEDEQEGPAEEPETKKRGRVTVPTVIALNQERYLSVRWGGVEFKDSWQFLSASLEGAVESLVKSQGGAKANLPETRKMVERYLRRRGLSHGEAEVDAGLELLSRKGVYPYPFVKAASDFARRGMWPREALEEDVLGDLRNARVKANLLEAQGELVRARLVRQTIEKQRQQRDADYEHARRVWDHFGCRTFEDYHRLYNELDVHQLMDAMLRIRELTLAEFGLDPLHFYGLPGLTYASAFKHLSETGRSAGGVEAARFHLETLTDEAMLDFVEAAKRGGLCQVNIHDVRANNKYLPDYDLSQPDTYLNYVDANNLYGWAQTQALPVGQYRWLGEERLPAFVGDILPGMSDDGLLGAFAMVDIGPPAGASQAWFDEHDDYPLCCDVKPSPGSEPDGVRKLIPDFLPKQRYVMHYRTLKYALQRGYEVSKVHRVLLFEQRPWLAGYIQRLSALRKAAKGDAFKENYFKLKMNALYGKMIENQMNRIDFGFVSTDRNWLKRMRNPRFKRERVIHPRLIGIEMRPEVARVDTLNAVGSAILELSKLHMQRFHYDVMRARFGALARLAYTDTDSLVYAVRAQGPSEDVYEAFATDPLLREHMDLSGYCGEGPLSHLGSEWNRKVMGKFSYECGAQAMSHFIGICPKVYHIGLGCGKSKHKSKGTNRSVQKELYLDDYEAAVRDAGLAVRRQNARFTSKAHRVYTVVQDKVAFRCADDKRAWAQRPAVAGAAGSDAPWAWQGNTSLAWGNPRIAGAPARAFEHGEGKAV